MRRLLRTSAVPQQRRLDEAARQAPLARVVRHIRPATHRVCQRMQGANCGAILSRSPIRAGDPGINAHADGSHRVTMNAGLSHASGSDEETAALPTHEYGHVDRRMADAGAGAPGGLLAGALAEAIVCGRPNDGCLGNLVRTGGPVGLRMGARSRPGGTNWKRTINSTLILAEAGERVLMRLACTREGRAGGFGRLGMAMARARPVDDERVGHWTANRRALRRALATGLARDAEPASGARRRVLGTRTAGTRWAPPRTGHGGAMSARPRWRAAGGAACVRHGWKRWQAAGRAETQGEDTACRQAGGPWRIR